ncbi:hypothetical protein WBG99_11330 [Streptomyces sp. TG1A-60]
MYRMRYTPHGAFIGGELLSADPLAEYQGHRTPGAWVIQTQRAFRQKIGA